MMVRICNMKRYSNIDVATYIAAHNLLLYHAPPLNIIFVSFKFLFAGLPLVDYVDQD